MNSLGDQVTNEGEGDGKRFLSQTIKSTFIENGVLVEEILTREFRQDGSYLDIKKRQELFEIEGS